MGMRLNEVILSRELDISRGSLRVALRQLETEGLVTNFPYKGTFVRSITEQDVAEIYEIRTLIETFAATKSMSYLTSDLLSEMEDLAIANHDYIKQGNIEKAVEVDFRFHEIPVKHAHNSRLIGTWTDYYNDVIRVVILSTTMKHDRAYSEHTAIVSAFRNKNLNNVITALRYHLSQSQYIFLLALNTKVRESKASSERRKKL